MKKVYAMLVLLLLSSVALIAEDAEITYREGKVRIKDAGNQWYQAEIGDTVQNGNTISTGTNGYLEMEIANNTVSIKPNTVFTLMESELKGKKRSTYTCVSGAVAFKIAKITGTAPEINTMAANAGVRGTEFTLFAAANGASLIMVTEGIVEVSAANGMVTLNKDEAVEVVPGSKPGAKFKVLRGAVDFSDWNAGKIQEFLNDPTTAEYRLFTQLQTFVKELQKLEPVYDANSKLLALERKNLDNVKKQEGVDAGKAYYADKVLPLEMETSYQRMNMRYWALSALSLRRYVIGRLYLLMKAQYATDTTNQVFTDYLNAHNQALLVFEKRIVPYLVDADL